MKFTELHLHESLLAGIEKAGYVECTPVQEKVLQTALAGRDLYVQSQTGTGKTAAFLIAVAQELLTRDGMEGKKALVMAPTRELAVQIEAEARTLLCGTPFKCASFYGGVGYAPQVSYLTKGVDIMVGTPGRVIDLQESGRMDLSAVAFLVIDEADRMFDMGFYPDLRTLIKKLPKSASRQTMLFSATLNTYVKNLAWEYTVNAEEITIESQTVTVNEIDQFLYHVSSDDKMKLLLGILRREQPESVIIFCNTKRMCEIVAKRLKINGIETEFIIGDLPQSKRLQVLNSFKSGSLKALIATDVAARGIDVNDLAMVVNYDMPNETENYVHRIGRTARAGKSGKAYTFCSEQDVYSLVPIERFIDMKIPSDMADSELFSEDKSAGIYIKLDSYDERTDDDERRGSRDRRRDGRSAPGRDAGRRDGKKPQRNNARRDALWEKPKGRDAPKKSTRNEAQGQRGADRKNARGNKRNFRSEETHLDDKLLGLPFDERLKRYKEKYQTGGSLEARDKRKNEDARQTGAGKSGFSPRRAAPRQDGKRRGAGTQKAPAHRDSPAQAPAAKTAQKGLLKKLFSLFKK
jgi:ATP-dependent RNA helicase RhlB